MSMIPAPFFGLMTFVIRSDTARRALADQLASSGDDALARGYHDRYAGLFVRASRLQPDNLRFLYNAGCGLELIKAPQRARRYYQRFLEVSERESGQQSADAATALHNLAANALYLIDYPGALRFADEAVARAEAGERRAGNGGEVPPLDGAFSLRPKLVLQLRCQVAARKDAATLATLARLAEAHWAEENVRSFEVVFWAVRMLGRRGVRPGREVLDRIWTAMPDFAAVPAMSQDEFWADPEAMKSVAGALSAAAARAAYGKNPRQMS